MKFKLQTTTCTISTLYFILVEDNYSYLNLKFTTTTPARVELLLELRCRGPRADPPMAAAAVPSPCQWQARSRYRDISFSRFFLCPTRGGPLLLLYVIMMILLALSSTSVTSRQLPSGYQPVSGAASPPPTRTFLHHKDVSPLGRQALPMPMDACTLLLNYTSFYSQHRQNTKVATPSAVLRCLSSIPFVPSRDLQVLDTVITGLDQFYIYKNIARASPASQLPSNINIIKDLKEIRAQAVYGLYNTSSVFDFYEDIRRAVQRLNDGHTHFDHCLHTSFWRYLALPVVGVMENEEIVVKVMPFYCEFPSSSSPSLNVNFSDSILPYSLPLSRTTEVIHSLLPFFVGGLPHILASSPSSFIPWEGPPSPLSSPFLPSSSSSPILAHLLSFIMHVHPLLLMMSSIDSLPVLRYDRK